MNRSILIVICDFLLVSLLVFSTVDINKAVEEGRTVPVSTAIATNHVDAGTDLTSVMKMALQEEQKRREALVGELARTKETVGERDKQVENYQQELRTREQELRTREQQQTALQSQFSAAQTNLQALSEQLKLSSTDATISKEKLAAMEAELKKRAEEASALQKQMSNLALSNQMVLSSNQQLSTRLQVAEVERRHAAEQAVALTEQVKVEREEKAKLAEGVKTLAAKSADLTQEIRENRALSPNAIFDDFRTNRVRATFAAYRSGLFDTNKRRETGTVLVNNGTNTYALCHVEDTPLTLWNPGTQWEGLTGTLGRGATQVPIHSLSFHLQDPRIVFMPVTSAEAKQIGGHVYRTSNTPFKFQDAVLIGAADNYYGECKFEIDPNTPEYLKLNRNVLKGLFGKFNPSRGDLVFSKTGELLGIMANSTYCLVIQRFEPSATFQFGQDVRSQRTGDTLASLYNVIVQMPLRLQ